MARLDALMFFRCSRLLSAVIFSTLLQLAGCGGSSSSSTRVESPSEQLPAATELSTGEAQDLMAAEAQASIESGISQVPNPSSQIPATITGEEQSVSAQAPNTAELPVESEPEEQHSVLAPSVSISQSHKRDEPKLKAVHDPIRYKDYDDVSYAWFKNGTQFSITSNPYLNKRTVRGDSIEVALRLSQDGKTNSIISSKYVVANTAPVFSGAEILPRNPTNRDTLQISPDAYDEDGDELEFTYTWEGYDSEGDSLEGTHIYPVNPLVVAYVTISDGIDQTTYKVTKQLTVYEEFYSGLAEVDLVFGQPVSFKIGYRDDLRGDLETNMVSGPSGMSYENGWITWNPSSPTMFRETETYYAHFESESGKKDTIELVVKNTNTLELTWNRESVSQFDENAVPIADCELSAQNADGSKVFCVTSDSSLGCGRFGCDVSGDTRLRIFGSALTEPEIIPLWSFYLPATEIEGEFFQAGGRLPVQSPQAMSYLKSRDAILFVDYRNRLTLFSTSSGYITWYSDGPSNIEKSIKEIDCPISATNASQCSYVAYDGFRYSIN